MSPSFPLGSTSDVEVRSRHRTRSNLMGRIVARLRPPRYLQAQVAIPGIHRSIETDYTLWLCPTSMTAIGPQRRLAAARRHARYGRRSGLSSDVAGTAVPDPKATYRRQLTQVPYRRGQIV
jgi:hypothetical protein